MESVWLKLRTPPTPSFDRRKYVQDVYEHVLEGVNLHALIDVLEKCGRLPASIANEVEESTGDQNE